MKDQTDTTGFILLGFSGVSEVQVLLFFVFLLLYTLTMAGNLLIVVLVTCDHHLHTPMYFFLRNFSCLEMFYSSNILPRVIISFLTRDTTIPAWGCFLQFYFFGALGASECYLLAAMAYDRYLAICRPLHYSTLMNNQLCMLLMIGSCMTCFLIHSIIVIWMSQFTYCSPRILDHFFCDYTPVLELACGDISTMKLTAFLFCCFVAITPFSLTLMSYSSIIVTIMRIPSTIGRQKAFSTCSSHLIVVVVFYGTLIIVYMFPKTDTLKELNKALSVFYTVLTPIMNPVVYCLRNREVKEALSKLSSQLFCFVRR